MSDTISGIVKTVAGSDTFELKVMFRGKHNKDSYKNTEKIKILNVDANDIEGALSPESKRSLEAILPGMAVRCKIQQRDEEGSILADIMIYGVNWYKNIIK